MAKKKRPANENEGLRHALSVGLPVASVLLVLVVGAVLQTGRTEAAAETVAMDSLPPLPPPPGRSDDVSPPTVATEPAPSETERLRETLSDPPAQQGIGTPALALARRASRDVERLEAPGGAWTAQVGVFCDIGSVHQRLSAHGQDDRFYLLPALLDDGRACFRICWGRAGDAETARRAAGLPAALRGSDPIPKTVEAVLR